MDKALLIQSACRHWFDDAGIRRRTESTNTRAGSRCPLHCVIPDLQEAVQDEMQIDRGFELIECLRVPKKNP